LECKGIAVQPHLAPRRILLATVGLAPQVLTETLFALTQAPEPFIPTEIHVITTLEGRKRVQLQLLDPSTAVLSRFAFEYGLPQVSTSLNPERIHVIGERAGRALSDISSEADNQLAANAILDLVRSLTGDEQSALHVSIAGGRKTMGFLLGYALSIFGRAQDRMSHVLVDQPFELHPDFFYPPKMPRVLMTTGQRPAPINTADARITLAEIPFVRLRGGLPAELLSGAWTYSETVRRTEDRLPAPRLIIDMVTRQLSCHGFVFRLPPLQFAIYAWLARQRANPTAPMEGAAHWTTIPTEDVLAIYARLPRVTDGKVETQRSRWTAGIEADTFEQNKSRINAELERRIGSASQHYAIKHRGSLDGTKYGLMGLTLTPSAITFASIKDTASDDDNEP
jgi:CRISPR-associated protein (TIGR02584 family)